MDFAESQAYLLSLGFELSVKKFGLENTQVLLEALRHPERKYAKVQVAGTNGKGSVCAFLESICVSAGIRVGLNTSPHLVSITERVRINGDEIMDKEFAALATKVRKTGERLVEEGKLAALPTYFEHVTAIALLAFAEAGVEFAILETGLGGRFDATTAARSEFSVITPIDIDHTNILGATVREIAAEKAAIIREDSLVVVSDQPADADAVIRARCAEVGIAPRFASEVAAKELNGSVTFESDRNEYPEVKLGLAGRHQIDNARTAIAAAEMLSEKGFAIGKEAVVEGLGAAKHKGRLEWFEGMLFDGAHNVSGARALRAYLEENVEGPLTMVFASMKEKDLSEISRLLFPRAENLVFATPSNPRAMPAAELTGFVPEGFPRQNVFVSGSVKEAVETARRVAGKGTILVTGSLYLIGEVQAHLSIDH
ncbi:MAG: bifunctional folylpolyglutamate synthase/dihydrofolate synthase [Acidobacteriota bacterium]|nr:MAG: bifunctional folylpolyglutamate synthase/dihydrofolate synthase [Acidobacteriota bacterium]